MHPVPSLYVLTLVVGIVVAVMAVAPAPTTTGTQFLQQMQFSQQAQEQTDAASNDAIAEVAEDDEEEPNKPNRPVPPPPWRKHHNHSEALPPHLGETPETEKEEKEKKEKEEVWDDLDVNSFESKPFVQAEPLTIRNEDLHRLVAFLNKIKNISLPAKDSEPDLEPGEALSRRLDLLLEKIVSIPPLSNKAAAEPVSDDEFTRRGMLFLEKIARVPFPAKEPEPEPETREPEPPVEVAKVPRNGPPGVVTIRVLPRSEWDPNQQTFQPARVVVTRAFRMCMEMDATRSQCTRQQDAWATAVCREAAWSGFAAEVGAEYRLLPPHRYAVFHTFDNLTYQEVPVSSDWNHYHNYEGDQEAYSPSGRIHDFDWELMGWARRVAKAISRTIVMRWSHGHFWIIPAQHYNMGERALSTGRQTHVETIEPDLLDPLDLDDRPLYIPL